MPVGLRPHAFAGNPLLTHENLPAPSSHELLPAEANLLPQGGGFPASSSSKVLPFRKGRVLVCAAADDPEEAWRLCWLRTSDLGDGFPTEKFVSLGWRASQDDGEARTPADDAYWAVDVPEAPDLQAKGFRGGTAFVDLRTLMVASDWEDEATMAELAIAGQAKALLEWHNTSRFCGYCGLPTVPIDSGRRRRCSAESCKRKVYPRIDPVVIMLVIDKANDRALLSRQSKYVPRMWSCLSGFIEPGESLEEAVRRETLEETGIEVGEVVYHSSQPWPVGPSSMPCQLMVGFFAYAKSYDIVVDKELEDARWHSREDVKKALTFTEYKKAQRTSASKVRQMCNGIKNDQNVAADFNLESGELAPMFIPGPYAIAHHLISSWANNSNTVSGNDLLVPQSAVSSL